MFNVETRVIERVASIHGVESEWIVQALKTVEDTGGAVLAIADGERASSFLYFSVAEGAAGRIAVPNLLANERGLKGLREIGNWFVRGTKERGISFYCFALAFPEQPFSQKGRHLAFYQRALEAQLVGSMSDQPEIGLFCGKIARIEELLKKGGEGKWAKEE